MQSSVRAIFGSSAVVLQILGCVDPASPNPKAASAVIAIRVEVAGVFSSDRFAVRVDDSSMTLLRSESGLVVKGLSAGPHMVSLAGLPANCSVDGANPVTVETSPAALSSVRFDVSCLASTGAIAVAVSVAGYDRQLWFEARVDSALAGTYTKGNATGVIDGAFSGGVHVVRLSRIPSFCVPSGELSTSLNVRTGAVKQDTALASFDIHCDPPQLAVDTTASIAFERDGFVMVVRESGASPVAVTEGEEPAWSADGKLITFQRQNCRPDDLCEHDLWLMTPGGENQRKVSKDEGFDDTDPALSPSGNRIAFMRFWLGPDLSYLAVSGLDGSSPGILSFSSAISGPSWSPDGGQIVFVCGGVPWQGHTDLCLATTDHVCESYVQSSCNLPDTHLTTGRGDESDPAWSHDGRRIAYTLGCTPYFNLCAPGMTAEEPYIAVIDVTTREITMLTAGHDPAWSPDDSQLVFAANASSPGLRVYSFADGSVSELTANRADRSPSWRR